jgi:hypothetical protein
VCIAEYQGRSAENVEPKARRLLWIFTISSMELNQVGQGLSIDKARNLTATHTDLLNWQANLRAAMMNTISQEDMKQIMAKQLEKAKEGDREALNFVMSVVGANQPVTINNTLVVDTATAAKLASDAKPKPKRLAE